MKSKQIKSRKTFILVDIIPPGIGAACVNISTGFSKRRTRYCCAGLSGMRKEINDALLGLLIAKVLRQVNA